MDTDDNDSYGWKQVNSERVRVSGGDGLMWGGSR